MMRISRRRLLQVGLGTGAVATLGPVGGLFTPRRSRALGAGPKKLLTVYVAGGWMPIYFFCPLTREQVTTFLPEPHVVTREPTFFTPDQLRNIDGTGDDPDADDPRLPRIRVPHLWDESALSAGMGVSGGDSSVFGWAWKHYGLYEDACVVHGIDQGTASHGSGRISAMCGVAGSQYRSPAIHAVVADALHASFGEARPLGAVAVGRAPVPNSLGLGSHALPTVMESLDSLEKTLSDRPEKAWQGLRERGVHERLAFDGTATGGELRLTDMDAFAMRRLRSLRGSTNEATDRLYEAIHETYATVSKQLALDLVSTLEATPGWDPAHPYPYWGFGDHSPYGVDIGRGNTSDSGHTWSDQFELALKLLKSDLCSAVSVEARGVGGLYFDTHTNTGHDTQFMHVRAALDVIGRLLGEMKNTPTEGGASTLLDDTLVVIMSEFARTWPGSGLCDHWPYTSVAFAGGNVHGNRMIGGYDLEGHAPATSGPTGMPVDLLLEGGDPARRPPRSADVVHTALRIMGIEEFFIPGGSGEVVGVRS